MTTAKATAAAKTDGLSGKKVTVTFHKNPESGGSANGVYIGLNGKVYAYQFEKKVEVPVEVLDIADNAVIEKFEAGNNKGDLVSTLIKRYPYSTAR